MKTTHRLGKPPVNYSCISSSIFLCSFIGLVLFCEKYCLIKLLYIICKHILREGILGIWEISREGRRVFVWLVRILNCNEASLFAWTISQEVKDIVLGVDTKNLEQKMKNFLTQGLLFVQSLYILFGSTARYYFHFNFNSFQMNITCSNYLDSKECTAIISHVTRHPLSWPDSSRILILKSDKKK